MADEFITCTTANRHIFAETNAYQIVRYQIWIKCITFELMQYDTFRVLRCKCVYVNEIMDIC